DDQNRSVSSGPSSTRKAQPWLNPADGARRPLARMRSTTSRSRDRSSKLRTIRLRRSTSWKSMTIHPMECANLHHGGVVMVPQRVAVAGAELQLLVLASDAAGCIGVDLASGAFVRAHHPGGGSPLRPYDVATCRLGQSDVPDWSRPELVTLAAPPRRAGRLR